MSTGSYWRNRAAPIIAEVIARAILTRWGQPTPAAA